MTIAIRYKVTKCVDLKKQKKKIDRIKLFTSRFSYM